MTRRWMGTGRLLAMLLFGYVLARPVSNNLILVPVLAAIGAVAVTTMLVAERRLAGPLLPALLITGTFAAVGLLTGATNPGFSSAVLVFVLAPTLYWLVSAAVDERMLRIAFTTAAVVTIFVGLTMAAYVAQQTGSFPAVLPSWLLDQYGAGFGRQSGLGYGGADYTQIRFYGLGTLVATGPMWVASLFMQRDALLPPFWLRLLAAAAATAGALSGGRRALALVLVLAPLIAGLVKLLVSRNLSRVRAKNHQAAAVGGVFAVGLLAVAIVGQSNGVVSAAWKSLSSYVTGSGFVGSTAADDRLRSYQAGRLLDAWRQSPVFGHGFGAVLPGFWRDPVQPWRWELQYHALLFQTGVVGALLIFFGGLAMLNALVRAARARPDLVPSLVVACTAAAGMLIGNASNPYLQAPGYVWAIFAPVAVANVMLRFPRPVPESPSYAPATPARNDSVPAAL